MQPKLRFTLNMDVTYIFAHLKQVLYNLMGGLPEQTLKFDFYIAVENLQKKTELSFLKRYYIPNLKLACFVCYLKTVNSFSKNNACILK